MPAPATTPVRPVIQVENLCKEYRLGTINHGMLYRDLQSWWARMRGRPDPNAVIREDRFAEDEPAGAVQERFLALEGVSFEVREGETFGIIGRNGAGKSTLLKILSRVTAPTSGVVRIRGRIATLLEVGTGFHPELTGRENVYLNGAILGMSRAEIARKFDEIIDFSQLARFIDTPVKRYSSGMYVRLAFSVAAHLDAEVLIVDEVLAVGDYEFQRRCLKKMREVSSAGKTVLLVSHNMSTIQNLCTRGILLHRGRAVSAGTAHDVIAAYTDSASKSESVPVRLRADRTGNGAFRFVDAWAEASVDHKRGELTTGVDAMIKVAVENPDTNPLSDVDIAIGIDNYVGERVTVLTTRATGSTIATLAPGMTVVEFRIPRLPFVAGHYFFTLFGTVGGVISDWVQMAAEFDVRGGDFYGAGGVAPSGQGSILVPYQVVP